MKTLKTLILQDIKDRGEVKASDLVSKFKVSRQAIYRHIQDLIKSGLVVKRGTSRMKSFYVFNTPRALGKASEFSRKFHTEVLAAKASEDDILKTVENVSGFLSGLSDSAKGNFRYAFTEMVNNAIDHSGTKFINIEVQVDEGLISFTITDRGVGIFERIREKKKLGNELESMQDLLKGKITTMSEKHSGEGIFFTSKVADRFIITSHKKILTIDNVIDDVFIDDVRYKQGTSVYFEMGILTKKNIDEIFHEYTNEEFKFDKSLVRVKLFDIGESYVSRSQAKRLTHALDVFNEIILDFAGVRTVGQGFADEVFRVFQNAHQHIKLVPINCNENVDFMIRRATNEQK